MTKSNKIKPTGTQDFNVENPFNKEEKKPRAPADDGIDESVLLPQLCQQALLIPWKENMGYVESPTAEYVEVEVFFPTRVTRGFNIELSGNQ